MSFPNVNPTEYRQHIIDTSTFSGADIKIMAMVDHSYVLRSSAKLLKEENERAISSIDKLYPFGPGSSDMNGVPLSEVEVARNEMQDAYNYEAKGFDSIVFKQLAEVSTISYSIYRDKERASALGAVMPKGFTRGEATIAGTMVFTVFHERILHEIMNFSLLDTLDPEEQLAYMRIDQLPPIDIFINFSNEVGAKSRLAIYGVEFMNEGQVMSVQDLLTENSVNYVARNFAPMHKVESLDVGKFDIDMKNKIMGIPINEADYKKSIEQIKRTKRRWL